MENPLLWNRPKAINQQTLGYYRKLQRSITPSLIDGRIHSKK